MCALQWWHFWTWAKQWILLNAGFLTCNVGMSSLRSGLSVNLNGASTLETVQHSLWHHQRLCYVRVCSVCPLWSALQPHGLQPARFLCPWGFLGHSTGMGCHSLLQGTLPIQGLNLSHLSPALAGGFFTKGATWEALPAVSVMVYEACGARRAFPLDLHFRKINSAEMCGKD